MESRRNFLKIAGIGMAGSFIKPAKTYETAGENFKTKVKIGVLLPKSNKHPDYPDSFMKGLRMGLNTGESGSESKFEIITENVNYGTPVPTQKSVERLISENKVHLMVGLLNNEVAGRIGETLKHEKIPGIITNAGENFMLAEVRENPYLFFSTLNLFQASYEAGKYTVSKYGNNVGVVTSAAEIGYDALFAFKKGVETAGGNVTETFVLQQEDENNWDDTFNAFENKSFNGLFALLSGNQSNDFFRNAGCRKLNIPIITTSFAADDDQIKHLGEFIDGIQHFSIWNPGLHTQENKEFVDAYRNKHKHLPNQFGFLGYQAGLLAGNSVTSCLGPLTGDNLRYALEGVKIHSPVGPVSINKESGQVDCSLYLCQSRLSNFNVPENIVLNKFSSDDNLAEVFSSLDTSLHSGYFNPYLFV
jgi:branched-chain amino acid transport system substrate-binding protein